MTPFHLPAIKGYVHTLDALLAKGANPSKPNNAGQLPIHSALFLPMIHNEKLTDNKVEALKALLASSPERIKRQDNSGDSVFHVMAANGFIQLISTLIMDHPNGAFYPNNNMRYPVHTAILNYC